MNRQLSFFLIHILVGLLICLTNQIYAQGAGNNNTGSMNFINYATGKTVKASWEPKNPKLITDENLTTGSVLATVSDFWVEIDLTAEFKIGGMHLYFDEKQPMPRKLSVQYKNGKQWTNIPEATILSNFDHQISIPYSETYSTSALRIVGFHTGGTFGLTEWTIWGADVPKIGYGVNQKKLQKFVAREHWICVNQVGYNLEQPKTFTVPTAITDLPFHIVEVGSGKTVYKGHLKNKKGDFSDFNPAQPEGKAYSIQLEGDGLTFASSFPFWIGRNLIQENSYRFNSDFFIDVRSMIGTHASAYGGSAWRDGTYYTFETPALILWYLSNTDAFEQLERTLDWEAEKKLVLSNDYQPAINKEPNDDYALSTVKKIYRDFPGPAKEAPDVVKLIQFGIVWDFVQPVSADPSGDTLGWQMHDQTIEKFAFFLYGYPRMQSFISKELYEQVLDSTLIWWEEAKLFEVKTKIGDGKGRHCLGHSIMPNLLMYEVAKRHQLPNANDFLEAAKRQTEWVIANVEWDKPVYGKGQRISEHKLITGLSLFQKNYADEAPKGLKEFLNDWVDNVIALSDNEWDFRRYDLQENWTIPSFNEAGNVIGFPACALSVALCLNDGLKKHRLVEIAYAHLDNMYGRNPANAHCANHPDLGFTGIERGWQHGDSRKDICARLETVRGALSSLPGSEMYPFNPTGKPRWGEGWTVYNALLALSSAYLNFYEGVSSIAMLKENNSPLPAYHLVWSDEFEGASLDLSKWAYRTDNKHRSIQLKENVSIKNGHLHLQLNTHKKAIEGQHASGAGIVSKKRFRYGYYEVRAKIGDGVDNDKDGKTDEGWHHSFWAMAAAFDEKGEVNTTYPGIRRTEIDCYENSSEHIKDDHQSGLHQFTQHVIIWDEKGKEWGRLPKPPTDITSPENFNAHEWHTYGFEWTPQTIKFYVDGHHTKTADYPDTQFTHDEINVWLTAIAANWNKPDQEKSQAQYDYFRFYQK